MTTLEEFSMVMYMTCLCVWSWWNRSAMLQDLLLPIHSHISCCEHVRNTAAAHITWNNPYIYIKYVKSSSSRSIQVELGKVEGFWSAIVPWQASHHSKWMLHIGGGWGEPPTPPPPHMIVKRIGCTTKHNKSTKKKEEEEIKQTTRKLNWCIYYTEGVIRTQQNSAGAACAKPHVVWNVSKLTDKWQQKPLIGYEPSRVVAMAVMFHLVRAVLRGVNAFLTPHTEKWEGFTRLFLITVSVAVWCTIGVLHLRKG